MARALNCTSLDLLKFILMHMEHVHTVSQIVQFLVGYIDNAGNGDILLDYSETMFGKAMHSTIPFELFTQHQMLIGLFQAHGST